MASSEPDMTSPTSEQKAVLEALDAIEIDAEELVEWAQTVRDALKRGDVPGAAEAGQHVDAAYDFTKRVELVETWAAEQLP